MANQNVYNKDDSEEDQPFSSDSTCKTDLEDVYASDEAQEDAPPPTNPSYQDSDIDNEDKKDQQANREMRQTYANKAYDVTKKCIEFWIVMIAANATWQVITGKSAISDTAMIAITTGVTVNVLACFLGVIRGLFPADLPTKNKRKKRKNKRN